MTNLAMRIGKGLLVLSGALALLGGVLCAVATGYDALPGFLLLLLAGLCAVVGALVLGLGWAFTRTRSR